MGAEAASAEALSAEHEDCGVDQMELHRGQLQRISMLYLKSKNEGLKCRLQDTGS